MKRSSKIALTLVASLAVMSSSCTQEQPTKRELYSSKEKCSDDWGGEDKCERGTDGWWGPHYYYFSGRPYYIPIGSREPQPVAQNAKFTSVKEGMRSPLSSHSIVGKSTIRGGFGHSASFHSSGG